MTAEKDAVLKALDDRVTASLGTADWGADTSIGYVLVNPDWLRAIVSEARRVRDVATPGWRGFASVNPPAATDGGAS